MDKPLMVCGHVAQGYRRMDDGSVEYACVICGTLEQATTPNLEGRTAKCDYNCGSETTSSLSLPFFSYHPNKPNDNYYCGCFGWD